MVIFQLIILLFSAVIHEVSHGLMAEHLGDPTAKLSGRLTLNPLKHLDPFGSIILPFSLFFISQGALVFGWAKPVPYNPHNLKRPERDAGLIAIAGPLSNIIIAIIMGAIYRLGLIFPSSFLSGILPLIGAIVFINIILAIFNLVPIPPLDGSKILFAVFPGHIRFKYFLEKYGAILLIIFIIFGLRIIEPIIFSVYNLII